LIASIVSAEFRNNTQSILTVYSTVAFGIAKPLDVFIYATLSKAAKKELVKILRCKKNTDKRVRRLLQ
jgi:hypothetical protein